MIFDYKMVQIPPQISVASGMANNVAAHYLEDTVKQYAKHGWEFYRVDAIGVEVRPGCLSALLGQKKTYDTYYVITFRKTLNASDEDVEQDESAIQPSSGLMPKNFISTFPSRGRVTTNTLFLDKPNLNSKLLGNLTEGNIVTVRELQGNWYRAETGGKEGYIMVEYVELAKGNTSSV